MSKPTDAQKESIAAAAGELNRLRNNWLNPPEWTREEVLEFPGAIDGPWRRYVDPATVHPAARGSVPVSAKPEKGTDPSGVPSGIGTVRYPRLVPRDDECAKELKKRTLTNVYDQNPTWLQLAHHRLRLAPRLERRPTPRRLAGTQSRAGRSMTERDSTESARV